MRLWMIYYLVELLNNPVRQAVLIPITQLGIELRVGQGAPTVSSRIASPEQLGWRVCHSLAGCPDSSWRMNISSAWFDSFHHGRKKASDKEGNKIGHHYFYFSNP